MKELNWGEKILLLLGVATVLFILGLALWTLNSVHAVQPPANYGGALANEVTVEDPGEPLAAVNCDEACQERVASLLFERMEEEKGFFGGVLDVLQHILESTIFSGTGLGNALLILFILNIPRVQRWALPSLDEFLLILARYRAALNGGPAITMEEAILSLSCALSTAGRILGLYLLISALATPLG